MNESTYTVFDFRKREGCYKNFYLYIHPHLNYLLSVKLTIKINGKSDN